MIGNFRQLKSLGKGGMGEVFLARDTICERNVALKQIRKELQKFPSIRRRFLREARVAAQLSHPSIIPIFTISDDPENSFYTMTYVEGATLKEILREARSSEEKGSIPHLARIFLSICQAIAYAHSKKILHRDLKPENVIVGKFGEVMILDWGLAQVAGESEELEDFPEEKNQNLTRPGKVVGTLAYLAPERATGSFASEQSDIYALGVILFQILTLKMPFKRGDLETFQKQWKFEEVPDPIEIAPDREIPFVLSHMARRCMLTDPKERYRSVEDLITDLESFIEGKPEWIVAQSLDVANPEDWEFQELIMLAKHMAISRLTEMEWVNLMISKASFLGNCRLETTVKLGPESKGIGFLVSAADPAERKNLMDGFCLWIGAVTSPGCKLFRNNIDVQNVASVSLETGRSYHIKIEKNDHHLKLYIDGHLRLHYTSQTPLMGSKVGILRRDDRLEMTPLKMSIGSQNVMVSCLAIPDAFLSNKAYEKAITEYRKIGVSFPGRIEGREATYRAGTTLALAERYEEALEEFGKLHATAGAPLEYLGKAIVYQLLQEWEEEAKCLELAIRKYTKHPLYPRLVEHIIFRLHESSSHHRMAAYHLALLAIRHLPTTDYHQILEQIQKEWSHLALFPPNATAVLLAFLLNRPLTLLEIIDSGEWVEEAFFGLLELGHFAVAKTHPLYEKYPAVKAAIDAAEGQKPITSLISPRLTHYLFHLQLDRGNLDDLVHHASDTELKLTELLALRKFDEASYIFDTMPLEQLMQENTPLFTLYGCYLWAVEGEEIARAHFSGIEEMPHPPTSSLLPYFIMKKINLSDAFYWEKLSLLRQQLLLSYTLDDPTQTRLYQAQIHTLQQS